MGGGGVARKTLGVGESAMLVSVLWPLCNKRGGRGYRGGGKGSWKKKA